VLPNLHRADPGELATCLALRDTTVIPTAASRSFVRILIAPTNSKARSPPRSGAGIARGLRVAWPDAEFNLVPIAMAAKALPNHRSRTRCRWVQSRVRMQSAGQIEARYAWLRASILRYWK